MFSRGKPRVNSPAKEHGTSETPQMEQDFSIIPVKTRKEEYLRRYYFFSEKFPVEKYVPFDLPPEQPVFLYKRKTLLGWPRLKSLHCN